MTVSFIIPIPYLVATQLFLWAGVAWLAIEVYQAARTSQALEAIITQQQAGVTRLRVICPA